MKKNYVYALMSAVALLGAVSLSACSSSDDVVDVNPTFDGEAVKTQFTISLPQNVSKTRQSAATVQDAHNVASFRGFDNMVLIPYASVSGNATDGYDVSGNRLTATSIELKPTGGTNINTLPSYAEKTDGYPTLDATNNNNSYVYSDVSIPLGTSGFLFYAKAKDNGTDKFVNGVLTASPTGLTGEKDGFGFALNAIKGSSDGKAEDLLAYINSIAAAASTSPTVAWYDGSNAGLKELYDKFITMKAGSSTSVQAALEDLYESLMNNTDAASQAVCTAILGSGNANATYTAGNDENKRLALNSNLAGYPADINLPDGAVALTWNTATPAVASWADNSSAWSTGSTTVTALANYTYPASLYYRVNSDVKVSNSKQSTSYSAQNGWNAILGLYNGSSVGPSTQSVALVEPIQYAVAQLKSSIKIAANVLKDKNGADVKIGTTTDDDGTFSVTGMLIGGQKNVDWQFLPTGTNIYTIYDKEIPSASNANVISSTSSDVSNYTLALENTAGEDVYIAVEFENNAKDFMGKDGLIAKGTKFYLVAKLQPSVGVGYTSGTLDKVFMQDYVTTAKFVISANTETGYTKGLGAAYNVIPDLRTPKMELGLSVDLSWSPGLTFNNVNLGDSF